MDQSTQEAFNGAMASINGVAANVGSRKQMDRAQKFNLETMEKQQQYYKQNYEQQRDDAYAREDFLNRNAKRIEVESLRNAGLNPAWNDSSGIVSQSIGSADGALPSGSGIVPDRSVENSINAFGTTMQMLMSQQMQESQIAVNNATAEKLKADAGKSKSETTKINLESNFLRSTQDSHIDFTNSEYRKQLAVNDYMKEHPETYEAVATAQNVINDNYKKGMQKIDSEMKVFRAQISKMSKEEALLSQQKILTELEQMFTSEQIDVLKDKNFRDNVSNPSWLLAEMNTIIDDPTIDAETAKSKLTVYGKAYDEISAKRRQERDLDYGMRQHLDRMDLGYATLAVHGASGIMEELNWSIERNDRNRWKKADYDQKDVHHNDKMQDRRDSRESRRNNRAMRGRR